jgi:HTH-type transcriptional regulator / antitoxin HigA
MATMESQAEAFPPGEYLRDELEERGWSEKEFAEILGRPAQAISEIMNGRKQIVPDTALAIGEALGTSADLWLNLQIAYNLCEARVQRPISNDVGRRARLRSLVPVAELRKRNWLPDTDDVNELEQAVKDLLGLADISEEPNFAFAARRSNPDQTFSAQQIAWLAWVRRLASHNVVESFDSEKLAATATQLVHRIHDPTDLGNLKDWLGECGVVLVTELPLRASKLDGVSMFLDDGRPAVGLTSRGDRMDSFVFTLLHECAHLLLGHLTDGGIRVDEELEGAGDLAGSEADANKQAADWILPNDIDIPLGRPSMSTVLELARRHRVHPSFVIGRIQRERKDWSILRRSIPRVRPYLDLA